MSVTQVVYISRATRPLSHKQLMELMRVSRQRNKLVNLTGLLLYSAGNFMQLLEGRERTIDLLLQRIALDSRHTDIEILCRQTVSSRLFGGWSMGLLNLDEAIRLAPEQFHWLQNETITPDEMRLYPMRLLKRFRERLPALVYENSGVTAAV